MGFAQPDCFTLEKRKRKTFLGLAALDSFDHQGHSFHQGPFGNQGHSIWSSRTKVPLLHLHSFEVKCDEEEGLTDRTESRTISFISIDKCQHHFHLSSASGQYTYKIHTKYANM